MESNHFAERLRVLRIIIGAMSFAVFAFGIVVTVLIVTGATNGDDGLTSLFAGILLVMATAQLGAYLVIRPGVLKKIRQQVDGMSHDHLRDQELVKGYATLTILVGAIVEGWGILGSVTVLLTGRIEFVFASGLAVVLLMTVVYPTRLRFAGFVASVTGEHCQLD